MKHDSPVRDLSEADFVLKNNHDAYSHLLRSACSHHPQKTLNIMLALQTSRFTARLLPRIARGLSSSPDYLNYETWHRDNYEHPLHSPPLHGSHSPLGHGVSRIQDKAIELPRTSVLMELSDRVGALHDVLKY